METIRKFDNGFEIFINQIILKESDDEDFYICFAPSLNICSYGDSIEEAKLSFDVVIDDFLLLNLSNKRLSKVLKDLGWELEAGESLNSLDEPVRKKVEVSNRNLFWPIESIKGRIFQGSTVGKYEYVI